MHTSAAKIDSIKIKSWIHSKGVQHDLNSIFGTKYNWIEWDFGAAK